MELLILTQSIISYLNQVMLLIAQNSKLIYDVIVPVICSIIGGTITYYGVKQTIKFTMISNEKQLKLANKPYINAIESAMVRNGTYTITTNLKQVNVDKYKFRIIGIIKNTDNGILRIQKIAIGSEICYKPFYTRYIDKNEIARLEFGLSKSLRLTENVILYGEDVLGNVYEYLLELKKYNEKSYVIKGILELDDTLKRYLHIES